jgi:hypothetical protein
MDPRRYNPPTSTAKKVAPPAQTATNPQALPTTAGSMIGSPGLGGSAVAPPSASAALSRLRPIRRTCVESPTPRSSAISRWVLPLVRTRRTASSSNSAVNRRCYFMRGLLHHRDHSTFPKQVHPSTLGRLSQPVSTSGRTTTATGDRADSHSSVGT